MTIVERILETNEHIINLELLISLFDGEDREKYERDLRIAEADLSWLKEGRRLEQSTLPEDLSKWNQWKSVDDARRTPC